MKMNSATHTHTHSKLVFLTAGYLKEEKDIAQLRFRVKQKHWNVGTNFI